MGDTTSITPTGRDLEVPTPIVNFFSGLNSSLNSIKEVQKLYDPVMAFGFNSFMFIWDNERKLSEIIAFFLNPQSPHGQGATFLKLFLEKLENNKGMLLLEAGKQPKVIVEKHTGDGFIDIVLEWGHEYAIGIENKCWNAPDQAKQLERYATHLNGVTGNANSYFILYLTPDNKEPWEGSLDKYTREALTGNNCYENITFVSFIIPLVKEWAMHCQAHRVQVFLNDFEQHLRTQFLNEQFMNQQDKVIEYALKPENIESNFAILGCQSLVMQKLFGEFEQQVREVAEELGFAFSQNTSDTIQFNQDTCISNLNWHQRYSGFNFYRKDWKNIGIRFEFDGANGQNLIYGFVFRGDRTNYQDYIAELSKLMDGAKKSSDGWPSFVFHPIYRSWDLRAVKDVANGKLKEDLKSRLLVILKKLENTPLTISL